MCSLIWNGILSFSNNDCSPDIILLFGSSNSPKALKIKIAKEWHTDKIWLLFYTIRWAKIQTVLLANLFYDIRGIMET